MISFYGFTFPDKESIRNIESAYELDGDWIASSFVDEKISIGQLSKRCWAYSSKAEHCVHNPMDECFSRQYSSIICFMVWLSLLIRFCILPITTH